MSLLGSEKISLLKTDGEGNTIETTTGDISNLLGFIPHIVTSDRAFNHIYQNTTGKPIIAIITCLIDPTSGFNTDNIGFNGMVDINPFPTTVQNTIEYFLTGSVTFRLYQSMILIIPNNYYYIVNPLGDLNSFVTISSWIECY